MYKNLKKLSEQNAWKRVAASSQSREIGQRGQVGDGARQIADVNLKVLKICQRVQGRDSARELPVAEGKA